MQTIAPIIHNFQKQGKDRLLTKDTWAIGTTKEPRGVTWVLEQGRRIRYGEMNVWNALNDDRKRGIVGKGLFGKDSGLKWAV